MLDWLRKSLERMIHPARQMLLSGYLPRTRYDYRSAVGDGLGSSVIMAPVQWIARSFPEAPLTILQLGTDGDEEVLEDHPLLELVRRPNPYYSGHALWMATITSWLLAGNAYWLKIRDRRRAVSELWYVPHDLITPAWPIDGSEFISHYEYRPGAQTIRLDREDVIHYRYGIDPRNPRLGLSPLWSVLREVFTDDEASTYAATILRNQGVPGVIISPADGQAVSVDEARALQGYFDRSFTGDSRGRSMVVMTRATKIEQFGFDPQKLDLANLRDISEERVCAVLGIPAAVVGFGAGLETTKVGATMVELKRLAWEGNIIPTQRLFAAELSRSLLPDFEPRPERYRLAFDVSQVDAMQENRNEMAQRLTTMVQGGWMSVAEARQRMGLPVDDSHHIFIRSMIAMEVPAERKKSLGLIAVKQDEEKPPELELLEQHPPPRGTMRPYQRRLLEQLDRDRIKLTEVYEHELEEFFAALGRQAAAAARRVLKASLDDLDVDMIMAGIDIGKAQQEFISAAKRQYLRVAVQTFGTVGSALGLEIGLPDQVQAKILEEGGRRLGLIDLSKQTRERIFRELAEGRAAGEGVPALIQRIEDFTPAGPWSDSHIRSRVIARTETRHAQRISTLHAYEESGVVRRVMVIDDRIGYHDEDCMFWDGREIPIEGAAAVMAAEHPNGTRDLVPVID